MNDNARKLAKASVETTALPFDIGNIRKELSDRSIMATFDWRIRRGLLRVFLAKKMPWWLLGFKRTHIKMRFVLEVESASGLMVTYPPFTIFAKRERVSDTIAMVNAICQSNPGALRYIEHPNERIRQLAYIKQTDFREVPIAFECINERTGEVISGVGTARRQGSLGMPAFMRTPNDIG